MRRSWPDTKGHSFRVFSGRAERQTRSPGEDPERTPERPRLCEFSSKPENSHGACNVDTVKSHDRLPMNRNRQSPSLSHKIVLMELALLRAVRRKRTTYGEKRPAAEVHCATKQTIDSCVHLLRHSLTNDAAPFAGRERQPTGRARRGSRGPIRVAVDPWPASGALPVLGTRQCRPRAPGLAHNPRSQELLTSQLYRSQ